jgi:hypothetical protein
MAFILILMMSITMLVQVESVNTASHAELTQARQNAIFGMRVALGQLQREMGPDQRISASASLLDTNPDSTDIDGVGQPYWTGTWESLSWDRSSDVTATVSSEASASDGKPSSFRHWLVSGLNDASMSPADRVNLAKAFTASSYGAVMMVGEGTLGSAQAAASQSVYVPRVQIDGDSLRQNGFAYWVGDEGVKANFGSPAQTTPTTNEEKIQAMASLQRANVKALDGWSALSDAAYSVENIFDYGSLEALAENDLGDSSAFDGKFHALTASSRGLLTDVRDGGFRKDLSLLFAMDRLPLDYAEEPMFQAGPAYGPEWDYVKRYYDRYKMITLEDGVPTLDVLDVIDEVDNALAPEKQGDAPLPVLVRVQYLFSLYNAYYTTNGQAPDAGDPANGVPATNAGTNERIVYLMVTPVLYIWNPYNVAMSMPRDNLAVLNLMLSLPPLEFNFGDGKYKSVYDMFEFYVGTLVALDSSNTTDAGGAAFVIPPGGIQLNSLNDQDTYDQRMFVMWQDKRKFFGTTGTPDENYSQEPRRNSPMIDRFDKGVIGMFSPSLLIGSENFAPDTRLPAGIMGDVKIRFNPSTTKFIFKVNISSEGSGQRKQAGAFEVDANSPITSTVFPPEMTVTINKVDNMLSSGNFVGLDPFLALNYDVRAFDELEGFGKAGLFTDSANAYYYSIAADEKALAVMPFRISFEDLEGVSDYVQYDADTGRPCIRIVNPVTGNIQLISKNISKELPVVPLMSIAQLDNAPLGRDFRHQVYQFTVFDSEHTPPGQLTPGDPEKRDMAPVFNRAVGNSFSHPMIAEDSVWDGAYAMDRSYFLNDILFDGYYFSGLADDGGPYAPASQLTAEEHLEAFLNGTEPLPNPAYELYLPDGQVRSDMRDELTGDNADVAYERLAAYLAVKGAFNVNSTSVDAWAAMLGSMKDQAVLRINDENDGVVEEDTGGDVPVLAAMLPSGPAAESQGNAVDARSALWEGFRKLTDAQIRTLAEKLVAQVKARGPFLSLGQFVNREISSRDAYNKTGTLQAAIDAAELNTSSASGAMESALVERFASNAMDETVVDAAGFASAESLHGDRNEGMPGYLLQSDLLKPMASVLSARSDTFIIRSYGDVRNGDQVVSKAWCEAVVQRCPDYVGDSVQPWETPAAGTDDETFGRRFRVVSFRWLGEDEV